MSDSSSRCDPNDLTQSALRGNERALAELFEQHRPRLRRMIELRLDRRLRARTDPSDVLQEAFVDVARQLPSYRDNNTEMPFFLWLRLVTGSRLAQIHRMHLGADKRAVLREAAAPPLGVPDASSIVLAGELAGRFTSVDRGLRHEDVSRKIESLLNSMSTDDREIIAMRHFEELKTEEIAITLGMTRSGVLKRYGRALKRLTEAAGERSQYEL